MHQLGQLYHEPCPVRTKAFEKRITDNGFQRGNAQSLQNLVLKITANPIMLNSLTVSPQDVRDIQEDAQFVRQIYHQVKNQ